MPDTLITKEHDAILALPKAVTPQEGARLAHLAAQVRPGGVIVQIGSYLGQTACYLGCGLMNAGNVDAELHCVDAWDLPNVPRDRPKFAAEGIEDSFLKNVKLFKLDKIVRAHKAESTAFAKTWNEEIDLLFIDAGHDYQSCLKDYLAWKGFLAIGGTIAFHDNKPTWPGVMKLINEIHLDPTWDNWEEEYSLISATRR